jgi:hypothetical protein
MQRLLLSLGTVALFGAAVGCSSSDPGPAQVANAKAEKPARGVLKGPPPPPPPVPAGTAPRR